MPTGIRPHFAASVVAGCQPAAETGDARVRVGQPLKDLRGRLEGLERRGRLSGLPQYRRDTEMADAKASLVLGDGRVGFGQLLMDREGFPIGFLASHLKVAFFADNNRGSSCVSWSYG
jgi:hypothetical protein